MPFYDDLRIDSEGLIWLRRYDPGDVTRTWIVQDLRGTAVALIEIPDSLHVLDISAERVFTRTTDSLGVQRVQLWRLRR